MKMLLGFFIGMSVSLLLVIVIHQNTSTVSADTPTSEISADSTVTTTDNLDVSGLMPDVGKIYRAALGEPYRQVQTEITDPDIAQYYHKLMGRTGLDKIGMD